MKIIEPSFQILNPKSREEGIQSLRFIESLARISHRSENKQTENSWEKFISFVVMSKGDWSVTEHQSATVLFRVDRGVTHELVRHRLCSFTQESTRFVNYGKREMEFISPAGLSGPDYLTWKQGVEQAEEEYLKLLDWSPQVARSILPNALASTIAMTGNLRTWRSFFMQRTTKEVHPDLRRITIPLLKEFQERIPLLYQDLIPEEKQSISMSKMR